MDVSSFGYLRVCCPPDWDDVVWSELYALFPFEYVPGDWVGGLRCYSVFTRQPDEWITQSLTGLGYESCGDITYSWLPLGNDGR